MRARLAAQREEKKESGEMVAMFPRRG